MVVPRLRTRNVMYFGAGGALLLATSADWSDERIVDAAFQLFVVEETRRPSAIGERAQHNLRRVNG